MTPAQTPYRIACAEIFGGIEVVDLDVCTRGLSASIHSTASGGARGGDVYYFSVCSSDLLTRIALADMRGHGEKVSHLSQALYDSLEQRMNTLDGAGVLSDLNLMCNDRGFESMTTAAVFSYYVGDSNLYFSYAGHPPAFIQRAGGAWNSLPMPDHGGRANLPLGALRTTRYDQEQLRLAPGDRLVLYTDGVTECAAPGGQFFGEELLLETLESMRDRSIVEIKSGVKQRVARHAGGAVLDDDCTLMVVEVNSA